MDFTVAVFLLIILHLVNCHNPSPCPETFTYEVKGSEEDRWYGVIYMKSTEELKGVFLDVILDRPAQLLGNWFGETTSSDNTEFVIVNKNYKLEAGPPVSVRFFVKYDPNRPVPSLKFIRLNGVTICPAKNETAPEVTTESLHISYQRPTTRPTAASRPGRLPESDALNIGVPHTNAQNRPPIGQQFGSGNDDSGILQPSQPTFAPSVNTPQGTPTCGTRIPSAVPLISHGQDTVIGDWPWHAALYYSKGIQLIYSCGATLITEQHVITAAHCVTKPHTDKPVNHRNLRIYLGKYNLIDFGNEVQERSISDLYVYPKYNHSRYYNDIAILKMARSIEITNYVRPICLWEEETNIDDLSNRLGTVVGWGFDQNQQLSNKLMQAQMPVVSTVKCIYSNRDFYSQFTSENSYCAGFRNGTSVCNGDSGGGMVFPKQGTSGQNTVWQIRGIVSVGVALQGKGFCDTSQYIVFTDVAKYTHWIRQVVAL